MNLQVGRNYTALHLYFQTLVEEVEAEASVFCLKSPKKSQTFVFLAEVEVEVAGLERLFALLTAGDYYWMNFEPGH